MRALRSPSPGNLILLFLFARLVMILSLPLDGLLGYGDLRHFFDLASLGMPFFDFWVEFPPLFPFASRLLFRLAGGRLHIYTYLLTLLLSLAQAGSLGVFVHLAHRFYPPSQAHARSLTYLVLLLAIPYGWWYFDPLAVLCMLLGLHWLFASKDLHAGLALGVGALVKWFPALALAAVWRARPSRRALTVTGLALGLVALVLGGLLVAAPDFTWASLRSQTSKGSWETVWALVDGNLRTGNFGPTTERFDPAAALRPLGNPPRLPPWLTLLPFALLGLWIYRRTRRLEGYRVVAFTGLTWVIYLLWSPGWSPQWVLYLLPLILLGLPARMATLMAFTLVLVNLLEWPLLLSRGYFASLWLTVPLRTLLLGLLAAAFWPQVREMPHTSPEATP